MAFTRFELSKLVLMGFRGGWCSVSLGSRPKWSFFIFSLLFLLGLASPLFHYRIPLVALAVVVVVVVGCLVPGRRFGFWCWFSYGMRLDCDLDLFMERKGKDRRFFFFLGERILALMDLLDACCIYVLDFYGI
ncbi:hypothetical protein HDK90DRAFT_490059, partial [Phyllosticta capitalensis]